MKKILTLILLLGFAVSCNCGCYSWEDASPEEATARFVYLDELVATAAYVTLKRIEGPFILDNASSYATIREAKDILVTVGADGNVEWGEKIKRILKLD